MPQARKWQPQAIRRPAEDSGWLSMLRPLKRRRSRRSHTAPGLRTVRKRESLGALISREALALVVLAFGLLSAASTIRPALVDGYEVTGAVTSSLHRFFAQWFGEMRVIPPCSSPSWASESSCSTHGQIAKAFSGSISQPFLPASLCTCLERRSDARRLASGEPVGKFNHDLLVPSSSTQEP